MGAKITKIDYFLPDKIITNEEISSIFKEWTPENIEKKIGVRERRVVETDQTAFDLAIGAANKVLENEDRSTIDFIILCTQSPDYFLPTTACILQDKLGLQQNIGAFDFNLGCSGYIYGLGIAKGLIFGSLAKKILFITSETYSKHINRVDNGNRSIFGDGATASIIEYSDYNHILDFELGTDGSGYDNLIVRNGGMRNVKSQNILTIDAESSSSTNDLYMNGPEIFNFTIKCIPKLANDVLVKNGIKFEEIDYFIFHQANKFILDYLRKLMKIPEEKFFNNLLYTGNTVSSTIPLAIYKSINEGKIKSGDKIMLVGFGVGLSWGATIIEI